MTELKLSIELPEDIPAEDLQEAHRAAFEAAILKFWQAGHLSTRQSAKSLGLTYHEFLDLLHAREIPVVTQAPREEVIQEALSKLRAEGRVRS